MATQSTQSVATDPKTHAPVISGILTDQARPGTSDAYGAAAARFQAARKVELQTGEALFHVEADEVAASIMRYLERVTDDDGGNAARYFPAVMVARMARAIAADLNAAADLAGS